jgi:radical SAM protein with 4Fe4S-binding SPASM domain
MNIVLSLTDHCNLNCTYCYYNHVKDKEHSSVERLYQAVDFFVFHAKELGDNHLNITFFGGEPLLKFDLLTSVVSYCEKIRSDKFRINYAINTNATLLTDERIDYFRTNEFRVYFSIDGHKEAHDSHRITHSGKGSFDQIEPYIKALTTLRTIPEKTVTVATVSDTFEAFKYIIESGFKSIVITPDFNDNWTRESFEILKNEYLKICDYYKNTRVGKGIYVNIIEDKIKAYIDQKEFKKSCCNVGKNIFAVSAKGSIYPCTRFVDNDPENSYCMGDIYTGFIPERVALIDAYHASDKESCNDCSYKARCLGNSCACVSYSTTRTLSELSPFVCEYERMVISLADEIGEELFSK